MNTILLSKVRCYLELPAPSFPSVEHAAIELASLAIEIGLFSLFA